MPGKSSQQNPGLPQTRSSGSGDWESPCTYPRNRYGKRKIILSSDDDDDVTGNPRRPHQTTPSHWSPTPQPSPVPDTRTERVEPAPAPQEAKTETRIIIPARLPTRRERQWIRAYDKACDARDSGNPIPFPKPLSPSPIRKIRKRRRKVQRQREEPKSEVELEASSQSSEDIPLAQVKRARRVSVEKVREDKKDLKFREVIDLTKDNGEPSTRTFWNLTKPVVGREKGKGKATNQRKLQRNPYEAGQMTLAVNRVIPGPSNHSVYELVED